MRRWSSSSIIFPVGSSRVTRDLLVTHTDPQHRPDTALMTAIRVRRAGGFRSNGAAFAARARKVRLPECETIPSGWSAIRTRCGHLFGSMPIRSFTAERMRCLQPRYRSVVWIETCPSRNWICSSSPPAEWHSGTSPPQVMRCQRVYASFLHGLPNDVPYSLRGHGFTPVPSHSVDSTE